MGATTGPGGGLLLADVAVGLLTGVVGPPGVLHEAGSVSASPPNASHLSYPTTLDLYLPPDVDAVLLEIGGMRRLVHVPLGEGHVGVIRPFEQHLVPAVIQADPEHVGGHCECGKRTFRNCV